MTLVLTFLCIVTCGVALWMLKRNNAVHKYRGAIIERVGILAQQDIRMDRPYEWRWKEFNRITYGSLLYKFWRPFNSFYVDAAFLRPEGVENENTRM